MITFNLAELMTLTDQDLAELEAIEDCPFAYALWWWTWRDKRQREGKD